MSTSTALTAARYALLAAGMAAVASAARAKAPDTLDYQYLVFPSGCLDKFLGGDLLNEFCLKKTVSKVLGYGIIAGAMFVKLPQILRFVAAGSVAGISRGSTYLELLGYLLGSVYHLVQGTPWSAYGETVIVTVQSALIVIMLWVYDPPGALHIAAVSGGFAAAAQYAYTAPPQYRALVMQSTTLLFIASRSWQIIANARARSTGELAFLTLFMNAAGAAARIFTTLQEVKQVEVLVSFIISTALNVALLGQYVWYNVGSGKKAAPKAAAAAVTAAAADEPAAPSSGKKSAGSARKGGKKRD